MSQSSYPIEHPIGLPVIVYKPKYLVQATPIKQVLAEIPPGGVTEYCSQLCLILRLKVYDESSNGELLSAKTLI